MKRTISALIIIGIFAITTSCSNNEIKKNTLNRPTISTNVFKTPIPVKKNSIEKDNPTEENNYIEKNNATIVFVDSKTADVNGDKSEEEIVLYKVYKVRTLDPYVEDLIVKITSSDGYVSEGRLINGFVKGPELFVGDLNGDSINDILVSAFSGGTGGDQQYTLLTYKNNRLEDIPFDASQFNPRKLIGVEQKGSKYHFASKKFNIDVTYVLTPYLKETFDRLKDGKSEIGEFYRDRITPIDVDNDGVYEIKYSSFFQFAHKCLIAHVEIIYKREGKEWAPVSAKIEDSIN